MKAHVRRDGFYDYIFGEILEEGGGGIVPRARVRGSPMNGGRRPVGTRKVWGSGKVLGGSSDGRELLEWSGKDGAESLRIFILYGRCFA